MSSPQQQQPGRESGMRPRPQSFAREYRPSGQLTGKVALITGGDSGIGRAVTIAFAKEGAEVAIAYLNEHEDARQTQAAVEQAGRRCVAIAGDLAQADACAAAVRSTMEKLGRIDVLVNNAGEQHPQDDFTAITPRQLERTFATNVFAMFHCVSAALPYLQAGSRIINTTSVTAYRGSKHLIDYASSKGAIVAFTRSLALALADRDILVNAVAPGPVWTPLVVSTFKPEHVKEFGKDVPLGRAGQPDEIAPCFVFLAAAGGSHVTGQVLHPNGGEIING